MNNYGIHALLFWIFTGSTCRCTKYRPEVDEGLTEDSPEVNAGLTEDPPEVNAGLLKIHRKLMQV